MGTSTGGSTPDGNRWPSSEGLCFASISMMDRCSPVRSESLQYQVRRPTKVVAFGEHQSAMGALCVHTGSIPKEYLPYRGVAPGSLIAHFTRPVGQYWLVLGNSTGAHQTTPSAARSSLSSALTTSPSWESTQKNGEHLSVTLRSVATFSCPRWVGRWHPGRAAIKPQHQPGRHSGTMTPRGLESNP